MPIKGSAQANALRSVLQEPTAGRTWRDAHLHIGQHDPDGTTGTLAEVLQGLDDAGHAGGLVFPMHEPGGYPPANEMIAECAAGSDGRLRWLCRVDPGAPGAVAEARRCLDAGAAGIKLHPRSDAFGLPHPVVDALTALAAERRAPVLFHAGRGIPELGRAAAALAQRHPDVRIVLAHAGISDLGQLAGAAAALPNLLFDTSWWNIADLLALVTSIPPGQVLYASDMPYGTGLVSAFVLARAARQAGLGEDALVSMAGAQLERVLAGDQFADLGPAVGEGALGTRSLALERVMTHTASVVPQAYNQHGSAAQGVALARVGCQHEGSAPHAALLDAIAALLDTALAQWTTAGEDPIAMLPAVIAAHAIAGTPGAGTPVVPPA